jgi:hypothetical protein
VSYNATNYTEQGSTRMVIGGAIDIISGGEIDIESGGALKIAGTAVTATAAEINKVDGYTGTSANLNTLAGSLAVATVTNAVSSTAGSTSFAAVTQNGVTLLSCTGSTASSLCGFRLPAPAAGVRKRLIATAGIDATHDAIVETNAAGVTIGYAATNHRLAFDALDEAVVLEGISATKWIVASNEGGVALSTDFTT